MSKKIQLADLDLIDTTAAARLLKVTDRHVRFLAARGLIAGRQVSGRGWVFSRADVEAYRAPKKGRPKKLSEI